MDVYLALQSKLHFPNNFSQKSSSCGFVSLIEWHNEDSFPVSSDFVCLNGRTQLLLPLTLNVAFRSFEPRIEEPFTN